jgi:branched-chain amino acid transport system substrate-binding protein
MRQHRSDEVNARRRPGVPLAALLLVPLALAGCAGTKAASKNPPLTIGVSLSLTGDFADPGRAMQRGYTLWAETVNANGGVLDRQVRLDIIDDASQPGQAAANYEQLITVDHVDLVFGPFSSKLTLASSAVVAKHGYAFIEPAGGSPTVFQQHMTNLFFCQPAQVDQQGSIFAAYILSLPKAARPRTAGYTILNDPFAQPIAAKVRALFEAAGIRTVFTRTYQADADLAPVVSGLAAARPDVVIAATQSEDAYAIVKQLVRLDWAPTWLYMSNGANSPLDFPNKVGKNNVNRIFSSGDWFPGSNASGSADFVSAYMARYGGAVNQIDNTVVEAYTAGLLIEQVATKTGTVANATIIKSLHSGVWPTPVGDLSWDSNGAPSGSYILFQWIDGTLQSIYPPGRAQHQPVSAPSPSARSAG